jgi:hypothetical protein
MKKILIILMLLVFAMAGLAIAVTPTPTLTPVYTTGGQSLIAAMTTATVGQICLLQGTYTVTSIQATYSVATPSANTPIFIYDAPDAVSTPLPSAHGITITAGANGLYRVGEVSVATNGSGIGLYSGQKFVKGICVYSPGVTQVTSINGH